MNTRPLTVQSLEEGIDLLLVLSHPHMILQENHLLRLRQIHAMLHITGQHDGPIHQTCVEEIHALERELDRSAAGVWN